MKIKINKPIIGHSIDQVVDVEVDEEGTPLNFFWRRQLSAAKLDDCCEIVTDNKSFRKKVDREVSVADEEEVE